MNVGLALVVLGGLILTIGDVFMKQWSMTDSKLTFAMGMFTWVIGLFCLAFSFKTKNIAVASLIFSLSNVIFLTLLSWMWYNEQLTFYQVIGIFLGMSAIVFLEM